MLNRMCICAYMCICTRISILSACIRVCVLHTVRAQGAMHAPVQARIISLYCAHRDRLVAEGIRQTGLLLIERLIRVIVRDGAGLLRTGRNLGHQEPAGPRGGLDWYAWAGDMADNVCLVPSAAQPMKQPSWRCTRQANVRLRRTAQQMLRDRAETPCMSVEIAGR